MSTCHVCELDHAAGELFVTVGSDETGRPVLVETCELEAAWSRAHASRQPEGALAFHATRDVERVMLEGLDPARANGSCKHVCLAETAGIAAGLELAPVVIEVDVSGLDLFFELGEARHHGAPIPPECLRPLDPRPLPDTSGWSDPFCRRNHTDCLAAMELPFSRRLLREAAAEADRRWWRDGYSFDQFKAVVDELSRRVPTNG